MSKFDEIYKKLIYESTAVGVMEDDLTAVVLDNNQFYNNYLSELALKSGVVVVKARFDTFRVYGVMNNIIKFLKILKLIIIILIMKLQDSTKMLKQFIIP